jgi:hypothetical protein
MGREQGLARMRTSPKAPPCTIVSSKSSQHAAACFRVQTRTHADAGDRCQSVACARGEAVHAPSWAQPTEDACTVKKLCVPLLGHTIRCAHGLGIRSELCICQTLEGKGEILAERPLPVLFLLHPLYVCSLCICVDK